MDEDTVRLGKRGNDTGSLPVPSVEEPIPLSEGTSDGGKDNCFGRSAFSGLTFPLALVCAFIDGANSPPACPACPAKPGLTAFMYGLPGPALFWYGLFWYGLFHGACIGALGPWYGVCGGNALNGVAPCIGVCPCIDGASIGVGACIGVGVCEYGCIGVEGYCMLPGCAGARVKEEGL